MPKRIVKKPDQPKRIPAQNGFGKIELIAEEYRKVRIIGGGHGGQWIVNRPKTAKGKDR